MKDKIRYCEKCGKILTKRQKKYCSNDCYENVVWNKMKLDGNIEITQIKGNPKCMNCGNRFSNKFELGFLVSRKENNWGRETNLWFHLNCIEKWNNKLIQFKNENKKHINHIKLKMIAKKI